MGEAFTIIFRTLRLEAITALVQFRPFFVHIPREGDRLIFLGLHLPGSLECFHEISFHLFLAFPIGLFLVLWCFLMWVAGLMMEQVEDSLAFV